MILLLESGPGGGGVSSPRTSEFIYSRFQSAFLRSRHVRSSRPLNSSPVLVGRASRTNQCLSLPQNRSLTSTDPISVRARDPCGRWAGKLGHTFDFSTRSTMVSAKLPMWVSYGVETASHTRWIHLSCSNWVYPQRPHANCACFIEFGGAHWQTRFSFNVILSHVDDGTNPSVKVNW